MRIWILTSELPDELAGGIARYVDNFARALGPAGPEVLVLARTREPLDRQIAPGVRIVGVVPGYERREEIVASPRPDDHPAFPFNVMDYWPALSYQFERKVSRLAREMGPPDVIEAQEYVALPYYLQQRKLIEDGPLASVPIVVHMHSAYFELMKINQGPRFRLPDYWVGQMEKFCILAADALLCPS
ncbi:MAG: glycosyltransferase, partial [Phycisphaerales bacterium]|nr:glycosyltransferase [Phycisphaerales bacterium]